MQFDKWYWFFGHTKVPKWANSLFATLYFTNKSFAQIVRDENKNSSFVTTNLNSFVFTSVPCVDFLCMWQLFEPGFSLPRLLINAWQWNLPSPNLQRNEVLYCSEMQMFGCLHPIESASFFWQAEVSIRKLWRSHNSSYSFFLNNDVIFY